jgi:dienelactone hydrolase
MSCCPPGSLPFLKAENEHKAEGTVSDVAGHKLYTVGTDKSKALVLITDIFGSDSGRHKAVADSFAAKGFTVVLVDGTLGKPIDPNDNIGEKIGPFALSHRWTEELAPVFTQSVVPHLKSLGFDKFATMGFCYGVWVQFKALNDPAVAPHIQAQVCPHPSIQLEGFHGGKGPELAHKINVPTLLLPAKNDPDFVQSGGAVEKDLHARKVVCEVHAIDQPHGFYVRGDVTKEAVRADVEKAFNLSIEFLNKHM